MQNRLFLRRQRDFIQREFVVYFEVLTAHSETSGTAKKKKKKKKKPFQVHLFLQVP